MDEETALEQKFQDIHKVGWSGVLLLYNGFRGVISSKSLLYAFLISSTFIVLILVTNNTTNDLLKVIDKLTDVGVSVDGGLIGLSLAGLTLVVTFGSGEFMKTVMQLVFNDLEEGKKFKPSIYQTMIAKFTYAVVIQVLTLIALVSIQVISTLDIAINEPMARVINLIAIFLSSMFLFYSLLLVLIMTINIFSLGQQNHLVHFKEEVSRRMQKENRKGA